MTETFREVDIPLVRLTQPYIDQLVAKAERLDEQLEALDAQVDKIYEDAKPSLEGLEAKVPDKPEGAPTAVEWLAYRLAKADLDVAIYTRDLAVAQARVKYAKVVAERDNLNMRIAQVDHVAEGGDPVLSPGNDDELAIWTLTAHEAAVELATAETCLGFASKRVEHAKKAQREISTALRVAKRAEERAKR